MRKAYVAIVLFGACSSCASPSFDLFASRAGRIASLHARGRILLEDADHPGVVVWGFGASRFEVWARRRRALVRFTEVGDERERIVLRDRDRLYSYLRSGGLGVVVRSNSPDVEYLSAAAWLLDALDDYRVFRDRARPRIASSPPSPLRPKDRLVWFAGGDCTIEDLGTTPNRIGLGTDGILRAARSAPFSMHPKDGAGPHLTRVLIVDRLDHGPVRADELLLPADAVAVPWYEGRARVELPASLVGGAE